MPRTTAASTAAGSMPASARKAAPARSSRDTVGSLEHAFLLFLIVFPAMGTLVLPASSFSEGGAPSPLAAFDIGKLTFYPSAAGLAMLCFARYKPVLATVIKALPIFAFIIWAFVTCLWAPTPTAAFNTTGRVFVIVLGAAYISARMKPAEIISLLTQAFAISITISLICIVAFPRIGYNSTLMGYESAWRGAMMQKNFLGALMNYGFIVAYYSNLWKTNYTHIRLYLLFMSPIMLVMSQSATAMIATISTAAFVILLAMVNNSSSKFEKLASLWVFFATMTAICVGLIFSEDIFALIGRSTTLTGRSEIWPMIIELIKERPIIGYGHAFWNADSAIRANLWARGGWLIAHAHNAYLDIWFQTGLVGFCIALFFIVKGLFGPLAMAVRGMPPLGFFWTALFFATFARSFTETQWIDPNGGTLFWTTLAYIGMQNVKREIQRRGGAS
ncbi:O-antigen ligase [Bosea sp. (in: a-proteobacteria)]|uniref:O-antigen ligase family protein n=1 Tax=Bosea sp. (in: a-proteobacteria) TaxID=1871050 RepID=UPI00121B2154|nr:O-antigen ligase [Bosea sp. (in: a-proteobacteria)]TAJ31593.1 MAG: O-antigen ligase family protein [Bosea sp. (in: a-proteobacteria)]